MHLSDAVLSPAVGAALWAVGAAAVGLSARALERAPDSRRVPLMGVLGAFVFAAQLVNFSLPGTGSSGHLSGGLLLAILLGPDAALVVLSSVLLVQALLFADGGLLAYGCNVVNLGVMTVWVAYPVVFRPLALGRLPRRWGGGGEAASSGRIAVASVAAAVVGLELGACAVVLETALSGMARLPPVAFLSLMLPVELVIGAIEGLVTAALVIAVRRAGLGEIDGSASVQPSRRRTLGVALLAAALLTSGGLSLVASSAPDGLEWSLAQLGAAAHEAAPSAWHELSAAVQRVTALFPDYGAGVAPVGAEPGRWEASLSGTLGVLLTLIACAGVGLALRLVRARSARSDGTRGC